MRADRLLRMIWMLSGRSAPTPATELADRLDVSVRTVLRDVEALSTAGVPVYTQQGRGGGVSLLPHWRPDLLGLEEEEARALTAAASLAGAAALGVEDSLRRALDKAAVSAATRGAPEKSGAAVRLGTRVVIDPEGWLPGIGGRSWLKEALAAVEGGCSVRFRYTPGQSGATREVASPALGLLCAGSDWYLAGHTEPGTRFFRLDRIDELEVCDAVGHETHSASSGPRARGAEPADSGEVTAQEPAGSRFDLLAEWQAARAHFCSRFHPLPAVLEVQPDALGRLRTLVNVEAVEISSREETRVSESSAAVAVTSTGPAPVRARVVFADISHALEALPRLAGKVRVLEPAELRASMRELARRLLVDYREQGAYS
ncbi:MAG: WYL domain-containing protein [Actinomyces succiniciruminis]|nr:WYL domain-containing protein [Actinomyces succiniciruminis]